ncbi:MAG TPA: GNAT family N-acetyltransferase [Solirubrobacteraceae bacterium]|nr:GNAT family N-acetyltransferase [Solirubrobacteraceae bacterium]
MPALRLRPLRIEDRAVALDAHREMAEEGFAFLLGWRPGEAWPGYLDRLQASSQGVGLQAGWVPASFLVGDVGGQIVGRVMIRHALTPALAEVGGHIGYGVRPGYRRRGHASEMLGSALIVARALGVAEVLVTCDDQNIASIKVIERHGGQLEDIRPGSDGILKRRYWIA